MIFYQILSTNSLGKGMKISLENLYVDKWIKGKGTPFYEIINICYNICTFKDVSFIICSLKLVDDKISNVILPL